jgi:hypothetical protein
MRAPARAERHLVLTRRDLAILLELHASRALSTRHLQRLFGPRVRHRLTDLARAGYIQPLAQQWVWRRRDGGGSNPIVYGLGNRGATALADHGLIEPVSRDWTERNRELSARSLFIPHELTVADARTLFQCAVAIRQGLQLLPVDRFEQGSGGQALIIPGRDKLLRPDWIFALRDETSESELFFVEVHRGTEPNRRRRSPNLQSLERKLKGYLLYARAKRSQAQFGVRHFRVLTITTGGEANVANIAATARRVTGGIGDGRFLVTSFATLSGADPFAAIWRNGAGELTALRP